MEIDSGNCPRCHFISEFLRKIWDKFSTSLCTELTKCYFYINPIPHYYFSSKYVFSCCTFEISLNWLGFLWKQSQDPGSHSYAYKVWSPKTQETPESCLPHSRGCLHTCAWLPNNVRGSHHQDNQAGCAECLGMCWGDLHGKGQAATDSDRNSASATWVWRYRIPILRQPQSLHL